MTELATDRLVLRPPQPAMAAVLLDYLQANHERFASTSPRLGAPLSLDSAQQSIAMTLRDHELGTGLRFFIFKRGSDALIGDLSFTNIVRGVFLACHLGYRIDVAHEGRGYMREALGRALRHVFDELGLHRVMANYMPTHARSGALLRRLGFVVEGYARDYLFLDGAWQDHVLTSLIASPRV